MPLARHVRTMSLAALTVLALAGCSSAATSTAEPTNTPTEQPSLVTIEDNKGTHEIDLPLKSVVALDNRTFETLASWGVELTAGAVTLMPSTISYAKDDSIIDIGSHTEPNLEAIVAVQPDVVVNGQRFAQHHDDIAALVPDAAIIELEPREGEPFDEELKRQITVLGEVFGKQEEAKQLVDDFDAAIERAAAAYDAADTAIAVSTSGGEIGYLAPTVGRTLGPVFDILRLTPALEVAEASDNHRGDDVSVEALAAANPDWILVMDRDAAITADDPSYSPASDILENSDALAGVSAVKSGRIVYMPADTYTNEGIQTYTEFFNSFADALEDSK